jgi:Fur family ferric uptake transcriptional regulator
MTESLQQDHLSHLRGLLSAYMVKKGLRSTEQRRVIVETFFQAPAHITIDELLAQVRALDSRVGYATVYRTLKLLAECGVAHERRFGDGVTRYEVANDDHHHDHLICIECGTISEFEEPAIETLQEQVAARHGFTVRSHKHELYGICADCKKKQDGARKLPLPRAGQIVLGETRHQRPSRDAEDLGGQGLVLARALERIDDVLSLDCRHVALHLLAPRVGRRERDARRGRPARDGRELRRQVLGHELRARREHDGALDHVAELAHVPGPAVAHQHGQSLGREARYGARQLGSRALREQRGELGDLAGARAAEGRRG